MFNRWVNREIVVGVIAWLGGLSFAGSLLAANIEKISGRVILDANSNGVLDPGEKGIAGVSISDGVNIVLTDANGDYEITIAADPVIPYKPAQVISMSWPSRTWPTTLWYRRVSDLQPDVPVNFGLRRDAQKLPFTIAHGSDPHNNMAGGCNWYRDEIAQMKESVKFCIITGDLGYAGIKGADLMFTSIRNFTQSFPIPMFHTPGNHDLVGIHTPDGLRAEPLYGSGAYTKYLGPVRWSFNYADVHFIGLDWARPDHGKLQTGIPQVAINWLENDLKQLKPGTRVYLFIHSAYAPGTTFWDIAVKYKFDLVLAGHSHRNLKFNVAGIPYETTVNLFAPYRLVVIHDKGYNLIDRCTRGGDRHKKPCNLRDLSSHVSRHGRHVNVAKKNLTGAPLKIDGLKALAFHMTVELEPRNAKQYGVRLVPDGDSIRAREITIEGNELFCDTVRTSVLRRPDQKTVALDIVYDIGQVQIRACDRVFFELPMVAMDGVDVEFFARDGTAAFRDLDFWELGCDTGQLESTAYELQVLTKKFRVFQYQRAAADADPARPEINRKVGEQLYADGKRGDAEVYLRRWADHDGKDPAVLDKLGIIYADSSRYAKAIKTYRRALEIKPDHVETKNYLAWVLATAADDKFRNGDEASRLAREVCAATQNKQPVYLETLAAARAAIGQFDEAVANIDKAIAAAKAIGDTVTAARLAGRRKLFADGRALHEKAQ
jgi:hypothetical protein